jgi:hypothetical protein
MFIFLKGASLLVMTKEFPWMHKPTARAREWSKHAQVERDEGIQLLTDGIYLS